MKHPGPSAGIHSKSTGTASYPLKGQKPTTWYLVDCHPRVRDQGFFPWPALVTPFPRSDEKFHNCFKRHMRFDRKTVVLCHIYSLRLCHFKTHYIFYQRHLHDSLYCFSLYHFLKYFTKFDRKTVVLRHLSDSLRLLTLLLFIASLI